LREALESARLEGFIFLLFSLLLHFSFYLCKVTMKNFVTKKCVIWKTHLNSAQSLRKVTERCFHEHMFVGFSTYVLRGREHMLFGL